MVHKKSVNYLLVVISLLVCIMPAFGEDSPAALSWAVLLDQAQSDPLQEAKRLKLVEQARDAVKLPVIKRAKTLAEVGQNRIWLDGRANALEEEIKESFALAMSDFAACSTLSTELPLLAAAYRITGETVFVDRVRAQLEEVAGWTPLQRPGWTLYTPGNRLPQDGKDGNWLATGCGVRAIADTLEIIPEGILPDELKLKVNSLLEKEIAGVVDDWQTQRPWFVRTNNPVTNQWVLPTEGLVRACLVTGVEKHRDAYDLGVKNLLAALDAHGPQGEFEEGFGYASFTVTSLLHAAHAMAVAGDRRAIDHPFLKNFSTWLVHHFQPGRMVINCFDAGGAYDAAERVRPLLALLAVCTANPVSRWALAFQVKGPSEDLAGLAAGALPTVTMDAAPPLFGYYERATRVNWRSGWDENASGVWVRGGHALDQHDHQDRGHVNFIVRGKPILIEAGTPAYHHPRMMTEYTPGVGHNVLQLGVAAVDGTAEAGKLVCLPGWQKAGAVAPIHVDRLDASGGSVVVNGSSGYDGVSHWYRTVDWDASTMLITDEVVLEESDPEIILFRWHLGTEARVSILGDGNAYEVLISSGTRLLLESSTPVTVTQMKLPDNTLAGHGSEDDPKNVHTCVIVQSAASVSGMNLSTMVSVAL